MKVFSTLLSSIAILFSLFVSGQQVSIVMQHGDQRGTGWNNRERLLKKSNVNSASFGKLFVQQVDDQMYAQPLVVPGLTIGGKKRNVVFAATTNNTVYAFDADSVNGGNFLWKKNFTPSGQRPPTNFDMRNLGACGGGYNDFSRPDGTAANIGIIGTPVIDTLRQTIYFVARSTDGSLYHQFFHAVDITTGAERAGSPVEIRATIAGTGSGSSNGSLSFDPAKHNQRTGLTLSQGIIYICYASHCDNGPYHGWVFGYDAGTLAQKIVYNTTPDGYNGGIWMSAGAPAVDESGNIYVAVGNGSVATNGNSRSRGESLLKLTPNLTTGTLDQKSYFTPSNYQALEISDLDFGVTEAMLIPNTTRAFTGCKDGNLYLCDRDNMGGFNATSNNVLQTISLGSGKGLRSSLAYYQGTSKEYVYTWSENAALKAFPYSRTSNLLDAANVITSGIQGPNSANNGVFMSVSSNGTIDSTGILWAAHAANGDANQSVRPGILRAIDANDVTRELWNSNQNAKDNLLNYAKFVCPVIANGKVYMATFSNLLVVYGITDTTSQGSCTGTVNLALNKPAVASTIESATHPAGHAVDASAATRWASVSGVDPQWIYVDLGARYNICRVNLSWEAAVARNFEIQVADDTAHWTTVKAIVGNTIFTNAIFLTGTGRYVRMLGTVRGSAFGYSLYNFEVYGTPANSCAVPGGLSASNITRNGATLNWNAVPGVSSYIVQYKSVNAAGYTSATTATNSLQLSTLACGTDFLFRVQSVCSGTSQSDPSIATAFSTSACDVSCGLLPTRWSQQDIGAVGLAGAACFNNDIWRIQASGTDIWGNSDQFHFAYKTFSNDGQVTARIDSLDNANTWNKAGVMFRESNDPGARHAFMAFSSGNGMAFQYRSAANGTSVNTNVTGYTLPYYVKLIKRGTRYAGYVSQDSITWKQVGTTVDLGFGAGVTCNAGLAATAHDNGRLSASRFSHVPIVFSADTTVNGMPPPAGCSATRVGQDRPGASSGNMSTDPSIYEYQAFDGNPATRWASARGKDTAWIFTDLGKQYSICKVAINWASEYGRNFQIQVSNDAISWQTIYSVTGNSSLNDTLAVNGTGRFVRMFGTLRGTALGYSIYEMSVFGTLVVGQPANLALNRPAVSSSNEGSLAPAGAVDGSGRTRWACAGGVPEAWMYVDLGTPVSISTIVLDWERALAADFDIQVSNDAKGWTTIKSVTGNTLYSNVIPVSGTGRYVRVFGRKKGSSAAYSLYEVEVYGAPVPVSAGGNIIKAAGIGPEQTRTGVLSVYPNPASNEVVVKSVGDPINYIGVKDLNGRVIRSFSVNGQTTLTMDISSLSDGIYVLMIKTNLGNFIRKVVKISSR